MPKRIYLTGIEKNTTKNFVSIGFISALKQLEQSLVCYKLFAEPTSQQAQALEFMSKQPLLTLMEVERALTLRKFYPEELDKNLFKLSENKDNHITEYFDGTDFLSSTDQEEFEFNLYIAKKLYCDLVLVISAQQRTMAQLLTVISAALEPCKKANLQVNMLVINQAQDEYETVEFLKNKLPQCQFIIVLPQFVHLSYPTMRDISHILQAEVLCGEQELDRPVQEYTIAAKSLGRFLQSRVEKANMLIIVPSDRLDILFGAALAEQSINYPKIAGIILTGGEKPTLIIRNILVGLEYTFPVLLVETKTFATLNRLITPHPSIHVQDTSRIALAERAMSPYFMRPLSLFISGKVPTVNTNLGLFLNELIARARNTKVHIVLPEGDNPNILMAADYLTKRNILKLTLIGHLHKIKMQAKRLGIDLTKLRIVDIDKSTNKIIYAHEYFLLRQHKNMSFPIALERINDAHYYATMMVYLNDADGMVSGVSNPTADTIRPALEIIKTSPSIKKVSSVYILCLPNRILIFGDCALNAHPDSETLAETAEQAVILARKLGLSPKIALISDIASNSSSLTKIEQAMQIIQQQHPKLLAEGPISYQAATDPNLALRELPHSKLAGKANILIFPDLNTGNNVYKAVQRETGALSIGPILLGLQKPINNLNRCSSSEEVLYTILVTSIQCKSKTY